MEVPCTSATILSRVKKYDDEGKHWDVQIQVDEEVFKTQRALLAGMSEYFETMFSSNFKESNSNMDEPIILKEMDAKAFGEVLNFMYKGELDITDSNVYQLLFMSDFLILVTAEIEERCTEYLLTRSREGQPIPDALDLFSFARLKGKSTLVNALNGHICEHLRHYSKDDKLKEMSFECLNALLKYSKNYILAFSGSDNILLKIILNWVNHSREERRKYHSDLMKNVDLSNVSPDFVSVLINRMENFADEVIGLRLSDGVDDALLKLQYMMEIKDDHLNDGDSRPEGTITFVMENLSQVNPMGTFLSAPCIISHLSWQIELKRFVDIVSFRLVCNGPPKVPKWCCYVSAILTVVSQKNELEDLVSGYTPKNYRLSSDSCKIVILVLSEQEKLSLLKWCELTDEGNRFMKENAVTVQVHISADVLF